MIEPDYRTMSADELAAVLKVSVRRLQEMGRTDLLLHGIGVPLLEELRIEAARGKLSQLVITSDFRFLLPGYGGREVGLSSSVWLTTATN